MLKATSALLDCTGTPCYSLVLRNQLITNTQLQFCTNLCRFGKAMRKQFWTLAFGEKGSNAARLLHMVPGKPLQLGGDLITHPDMNT